MERGGSAGLHERNSSPFISSFVRLGCSSVIECLPSVCQVLGSIPSTVKQESEREREYHCGSRGCSHVVQSPKLVASLPLVFHPGTA